MNVVYLLILALVSGLINGFLVKNKVADHGFFWLAVLMCIYASLNIMVLMGYTINKDAMAFIGGSCGFFLCFYTLIMFSSVKISQLIFVKNN